MSLIRFVEVEMDFPDSRVSLASCESALSELNRVFRNGEELVPLAIGAACETFRRHCTPVDLVNARCCCRDIARASITGLRRLDSTFSAVLLEHELQNNPELRELHANLEAYAYALDKTVNTAAAATEAEVFVRKEFSGWPPGVIRHVFETAGAPFRLKERTFEMTPIGAAKFFGTQVVPEFFALRGVVPAGTEALSVFRGLDKEPHPDRTKFASRRLFVKFVASLENHPGLKSCADFAPFLTGLKAITLLCAPPSRIFLERDEEEIAELARRLPRLSGDQVMKACSLAYTRYDEIQRAASSPSGSVAKTVNDIVGDVLRPTF